MSDFGDSDDDGFSLERGQRTDSYMLAVQSNNTQTTHRTIGISPIKSPKPQKTKTSTRRVRKEVYEAYIIRESAEPEPPPVQTQLIVPPAIPPPEIDGVITTIDQLDYFRRNGFWSTSRRTLVLLILLIWILLLLLALWLIWRSPRCGPLHRGWWEYSVIYEIWTPSFRDSDGDGVGDLRGIGERFGELESIGVDVLYPRPFLSTDDPDGLAILDWEKVDERVGGSVEEAAAFIQKAHRWGLKVIVDFPVAATSINHSWFRRSAAASLPQNQNYAQFYYWKENIEINEFVSLFNTTNIAYYHIEDHPELPVLNYALPNVSTAIKSSLEFWLKRGVDGFHLRSVDYLSRTMDGRRPNWWGIISALRDLKDHIGYFVNMSGIDELRSKQLFFFASMFHIGELDKIKLGEKAGLDGVLNSELLRIAVGNKICEKHPDNVADCANEVIGDILQFHDERSVWPLWQFGNAETSRLASRTATPLQAELLLMIELMLPGTPILYYGDELGIRDHPDSFFPQRSAMAWSSAKTADFSDGDIFKWKSKLPSEWKAMNFRSQKSDPMSHLRTLKRMISIRRRHERAFLSGRTYVSKSYRNSFAVSRFLFENENGTNFGEVFVLAVNFGPRSMSVSLTDSPPYNTVYKQCGLADRRQRFWAEVIAVSSGVARLGTHSVGEWLDISSGVVELGADQGVLFRFSVHPPSFWSRCPQ